MRQSFSSVEMEALGHAQSFRLKQKNANKGEKLYK